MAITAAEREELHGLVRQQLGDRGADLLMAGLAAADLEAIEERLTLRIERTRAEMRSEVGEVRGQVHELRGEVGTEIGRVRSETGAIRAELGEFRGEVGQEFGKVREEFGKVHEEFGKVHEEFGKVHEELGKVRGEMAAQNRVIVFAMVTAGVGVVSIVLGLAGLVFTAVQLASA